MISVHANSLGGLVLVNVLGALVVIGFGAVALWAGKWLSTISMEAERKDKRIELSALMVSGLAFLLSIVSLGVSLYAQNDADARITKLEQAAAAPTAAPVKPAQQGP